jgi:pimeloyl-ACP methyl ester carboxylesterase
MKIDLSDTRVGGFNFEFLRAVSYGATDGSELGEAFATARQIKDGDFSSWIEAWSATAERVFSEAIGYLKKGQLVSARKALLRASNYYRAAEFYARHDDPRQLANWKKSRESFIEAAKLMSPPIEALEIPFEGARLPGYFVSGGEGKRPTLIALSGFDGSGEELYHMIGRAAADRGWHCLIFEGPGQRGALHLNPGLVFRPDYEAPVRAVVDFALSREDVDEGRLSLIGYSFGGYLAPRAAAFEPRIRACIADSLLVDVAQAWRAAWPALLRDAPNGVFDASFSALGRANPDARWSMDHACWAMGVKHPHEFFKAFEPYALWGLEEKLRCPLLCLFGEDEVAQTDKRTIEETVRYLGALQNKRDIHVFPQAEGASAHCQIGGLGQSQAMIFDWLERAFEETTQAAEISGGPKLPARFLDAIREHHGREFADHLAGLGVSFG